MYKEKIFNLFFGKCLIVVSALLITVGLASCSSDPWSDWGDNNLPGGGGGGGNTSGTSGNLMTFDVLSGFTVDLNTSSLSESETIPTDETDDFYTQYVESNFTAQNTATVKFSGTSATVSGLPEGDSYTTDGGKVTITAQSKGLVLNVTGTTTDGCLKVYSDKKFRLNLSSASITNPDGAAVNIQNGKCFLVLSGSNTLADGSSATYSTDSTEDMKAVLFAEDDLRISGTGSLTITAQNAQGKSGISCDDQLFIRPNTNIQITCGSSAGNGIKSNEDMIIRGGVINIQTAANGSKGLSSDADMQIDGGRITAITTGGVDTSTSNDYSGCAAIKADSLLTINGGELYLKSTGQGGKGISCDVMLDINGGDLYIITEGSQYGSSSQGGMGGPGGWGGSSSSNNSVSPKGIRCDGNITISGGNVYVRTAGSNAEGIESKATLTFKGGNTAALAYDDGFNASTAINISGGKALAVSSGQCDGMDSNGTITATGGVLIGVASTLGSEDGIDYERSLTVSNATVLGFSSGGMNAGNPSGHYISTTISGTAGDYAALTSGSTPLVVFKLPRTYSSGRLLLSTPNLSSGNYSLWTGVTPSGGTLWMNYYDGGTSVSGGTSTSVTAK